MLHRIEARPLAHRNRSRTQRKYTRWKQIVSVVREFSRFWDRVDAILMVGDAQNSILYSS